MKLEYLASPYSHRDEAVREARFLHAAKAATWLIQNYPDMNVFSPIVHSHVMHLQGLGGDWTFWQRLDTDFLERCEGVIILCLPGWRESTGVNAETKIAGRLCNIEQIRYLIPMGEDNYLLTTERPVECTDYECAS